MKQKIYQVDAFTSKIFGGNPAAVCILHSWPTDALMQKIANENNLSETAFAVAAGEKYEIRWFTPEVEVDLCGHATLATAFVLFNYYNFPARQIEFYSIHSGTLYVERPMGEGSEPMLTLNFPADHVIEIAIPEMAIKALKKTPLKAYKGKSDYMFVYPGQGDIEDLKPDFGLLARLGERGVIVTSMGTEVDFVSRFFAPQSGINEDPVTGSAHTTLAPYWARVSGKKKLTARQISARGGELECEYLGDRVKISGVAVTYMVGEIELT